MPENIKVECNDPLVDVKNMYASIRFKYSVINEARLNIYDDEHYREKIVKDMFKKIGEEIRDNCSLHAKINTARLDDELIVQISTIAITPDELFSQLKKAYEAGLSKNQKERNKEDERNK